MNPLRPKNSNGFTIMELIVVVIIVSVIAAFAIPNYQKSIRKAQERDAIRQLSILHAANAVHIAANQFGMPYATPTSLPTTDISVINDGLGISLTANDKNFYYEKNNTEYIASFTWTENGTNIFTVRVDETPLDANNPCCLTAGKCKLVPDC